MECCVCQEKTATVHLTRIVGEKMEKSDLCADCAKAMGVDAPDVSGEHLYACMTAARKAAANRKTL